MNWHSIAQEIIDHPWPSITGIIAACSLAHTLLPPYDWKPSFVEEGLAEFPVAQKVFYGCFNNRYYKLAVYTVGYVALNGRSTIWKFISVKNAAGPNASLKTIADTIASGEGTASKAQANQAAVVVVAADANKESK